MALSRDDIIAMAEDFTEGRVKRLNLQKWLDIELSIIIQKKRYWWRRKRFTFSSVVSRPTYNLGVDGDNALNVADDLEQLISLYRTESDGSSSKIWPIQAGEQMQEALADTSPGTPSHYLFEPGSTLVIRLTPVADAVQSYSGLYWATHNPRGSEAPSEPESAGAIPLIPPSHHHVPLEGLLARMFLHLYGHKDARYAAQRVLYTEALADLMRLPAPASEMVTELATQDESVVIRATS